MYGLPVCFHQKYKIRRFKYQHITTYESLLFASRFINWQLPLKWNDFQMMDNSQFQSESPKVFVKNVNYLDALPAYKIKYVERTLI